MKKVNTVFLTGTQKAIFEQKGARIEEILNEEGLTMRGVVDKNGEFLITAEPMHKVEISARVAVQIKKELGINSIIRL